jgi:hypothetical protein
MPIVAHPHDCACEGCEEMRRLEAAGEVDRTPPWPPLRKPKENRNVPA